MKAFMQILTSARQNKENIFRKMNLLAVVINTDEQFKELRQSQAYMEAHARFLTSAPNCYSPSLSNEEIRKMYALIDITADALIDQIERYVADNEITTLIRGNEQTPLFQV